MRGRSIKVWSTLIVILFTAVCALGIVRIHDKYFFNPLTFKNNDVLYLNWSQYTKPLNLQIYTLTGPAKLVTITNQSEIRDVITELEQGSMKKDTMLVEMSNPKRPSYGVMIRTHNTVLQTVILYPNNKIAQIATQKGNVTGNELISLTPNLLQYVQARLGDK